jgi:hypothetical protein
MPTLQLCRSTPLSPPELEKLPLPLVPVALGTEVVAQAQIDLPLPELLQIAFTLGKTFPDATLKVEVPAAPAPAPAPPPSQDPWSLAKDGRYEEAEQALGRNALDSAGRDRIRALMNQDAKAAAFACRVSAATGWKSNAVNLRGLLGHASPEVRAAAAAAIGELAGPALGPAVRPLLQDADPQVRAAAEVAMKKLGW